MRPHLVDPLFSSRSTSLEGCCIVRRTIPGGIVVSGALVTTMPCKLHINTGFSPRPPQYGGRVAPASHPGRNVGAAPRVPTCTHHSSVVALRRASQSSDTHRARSRLIAVRLSKCESGPTTGMRVARSANHVLRGQNSGVLGFTPLHSPRIGIGHLR